MGKEGKYIRQMNERGSLTIPPEIRKHLHLKGSDYLNFKITKSGSVEVVKVEIREVRMENKLRKEDGLFIER